MDQWDQIQEDIRRENEARERAARDAVTAEREARREGRETQSIQINRALLWAAIASSLVAVLAAGAALWQGYESHEARKDAQTNFETTRKDAANSAAQARQDALDAINQQLEAQRELRDQSARSARATEASAATAARTLSASQRPWLAIDATSSGSLEINELGLMIRVPVRLKNVGKSIATGIRTQVQFLPAPMGRTAFQATAAARDNLCRNVRGMVANGPDSDGQSIFFDSEGTTTTWGVEISKSKADAAFARDGGIEPMLLICAAYHATYDRKVHTTARVLVVLRIDPVSHAGTVFWPPARPVTFQSNEFSLVPNIFADYYAD